MKPKIKASEMLRNPKHEQTFGYMFKGNKTCAVGEILYQSGVKLDTTTRVLPSYSWPRLKRLGFDDDIYTEIVRMNDSMTKTFKQIADWLEERGL